MQFPDRAKSNQKISREGFNATDNKDTIEKQKHKVIHLNGKQELDW